MYRRMLICIVSLLALITVPASANLVLNPSFEDGTNNWTFDFAGWGYPGFEQGPPDTAPGDEGVWNPGSTPAHDVVLRRSVGINLAGCSWVYQVVNTNVGVWYQLSAWFAGGVGGAQDFNGTAWWEVGIIPGPYDKSKVDQPDPEWIAGKVELGGPGGGFSWTPALKTFEATDSQYTVYLKWGAWTPDWQWNYFGAYFDSVVLCGVPEPATVLLLGLGGLALIRRRK